MTKKAIAIAIDGPAAAGKSTVAKLVAKELNYIYIDTGAMYRALTYSAIENGIDLNDEDRLFHQLSEIKIDLKQSGNEQKVYINEQDVSELIRTDQVTNAVSTVAKHKKVREEMVERQQQLAKRRGVVMDGRDIGTRVIPDAELKVFLLASVDERAQRRYLENQKKGYEVDLSQLKEEIRKRDQLDSEREVSPLIKADDAIELDTTSRSIQDVKSKIIDLIAEKGWC
ncbi:cytidylate kinase [Pelagirhabdus alkalitolerans]|uniref:Cytidylate kinase n=1 Tax=Pelagirhabdus alkalitolerans TaxID=1612202 RepID=A0A1G6HB66_9BACI|nr:(d)CMP kinase [Pelagirhabdus alkalitolerans]SDB91441.1 cytidylate kinase [Pelagirhabdus alkalitolerans]